MRDGGVELVELCGRAPELSDCPERYGVERQPLRYMAGQDGRPSLDAPGQRDVGCARGSGRRRGSQDGQVEPAFETMDVVVLGLVGAVSADSP